MAPAGRGNLNLPNSLTLLRILLVPVLFPLMLKGRDRAALAVFLAAGATDVLDGYLARRLHQITDTGKLLDPLADKLMALCTLFLFVLRGVFPLAALLLLLVKEGLMVAGGLFLYRRSRVVSSRPVGKAAQAACVSALTLGFFHGPLSAAGFPVHRWLLWVSVALSLAALVYYYRLNMAKPRAPGEDAGPPEG